MTAEGVSGREIPSLGPHGHEPVGIHDVNLAGDNGEGHVQDVLGVVGWVVVNDASSCVLKPTLEKARGLFSLGFDVGDVGHGGPIEGGAVVHHALKNEGGDAIVRPAMLKGQTFDDDQRDVVLLGEVHSVLKGVVPLCSSRRRHPIHDDFAGIVGNAVNLQTAAGNHDEPPR